MSYITTPNMNLLVPAVGNEPGPNYAFDINSSMALIDTHNHSPGYGVQITPSGLNINDSVTFNNNFATNIAGVTLYPQSSTPPINTVYDVAGDLYFVDGLNRTIQITSNGNVNSGAGSINGLPSGTASASYISINGTFVWQSATNIPANMDFGAALFRNLTSNVNYVKVQPPASLASTWTLTLPQLPSGGTKLVTLSTAGVFAAVTDVDNVTITISSNLIGVAAGGIGTAQIANGAVTLPKLSVSFGQTVNTYGYTGAPQTLIIPAGVNSIQVSLVGGGGGGGGGTASSANAPAGAGGGGGGAVTSNRVLTVTPGETVTINVGIGGGGGAGGASTNLGPQVSGTFGLLGGDSSVSGTFGVVNAKGAMNGNGSSVASGGAGGGARYPGFTAGGAGGAAGFNGIDGQDSFTNSRGTGAGHTGVNTSGGGGGGAATGQPGTQTGGNGGAGSVVTAGNNGSNGGIGSGGGGGGGTSLTTASTVHGGNGGNGGNGQVIISYLDPT